MTKVFFREEQKLLRGRLFLIAIPLWLAVLIVFGISFFETRAISGKTDPDLLLSFFIIFIVLILLSFLFLRLRLIVEIRDNGINYKYPPVLRKFRSINSQEIERYEIRKYRPFLEYGGHGIKLRSGSLRRRKWGIAYTAYGKTGLQLFLTSGKKILIGTQRPEAILHVIEKLQRNDQRNESTEKKTDYDKNII